jgi:hypothetical protein
MTNDQAPNPNQCPNPNTQLVIVAWDLIGIWFLGFGH